MATYAPLPVSLARHFHDEIDRLPPGLKPKGAQRALVSSMVARQSLYRRELLEYYADDVNENETHEPETLHPGLATLGARSVEELDVDDAFTSAAVATLRGAVPRTEPWEPPTRDGIPLVPPPQLDTVARPFLVELDQRQKILVFNAQQRHQTFLKAITFHAREFREFHRAKWNNQRAVTKSLKLQVTESEKTKQKDIVQAEKLRVKALKENDMEAYQQLVSEAKNERLQFLLNQTDEYLASIGAMMENERDEKPGTAEEKTQSSEFELGGSSHVEQIATGTSQAKYYRLAHRRAEKIVQQPKMLMGGTLKKYQMAGLEWLVSLYNNNLNGILADEMGLGKTIQTIALVAYLMEVKKNNGPFLVVVPLSTLSNWASEFEKWAPDIIVIQYKGNPTKRKAILRDDMGSGKFNVLLTTYEYCMRDRAALKRTYWQYIIIDEGHRMKNSHCKFSRVLGTQYQSRHRILLTGTPLQNNLPELWSLLNFLLPKIFNSVENFEAWFNKPFSTFGGSNEDKSLSTEEKMLVINRLHQVLRPFLLRRVKKDVLNQLPEKVERVIRCELSGWQKLQYRQIQEDGVLLIKSGKGASNKGLTNTIMQLRKVCNHPFLFLDSYHINDNLWRCAGKFELLDRMLPKLKVAGHRVLIFCQMTQVMDLLEDYFAYRGYMYLRLDGSTAAHDREQRMWQFNAEDSPHFIFCLSTRAGGLGINLATADTVILFDSDWNPSMDLQAQDRAHRIGQTREVHVFRLATAASVEEKILSRASGKRSMEALVIDAGQFNDKGAQSSSVDSRKELLEEILSMSTEEIREEIPDDEQINEMLARDEEEFALYQKMDEERLTVDRQYGTRLMREEEAPDWLRGDTTVVTEAYQREQELATHGRGARERKRASYGDHLTEKQFMKLVDAGVDADDLELIQKGLMSIAEAEAKVAARKVEERKELKTGSRKIIIKRKAITPPPKVDEDDYGIDSGGENLDNDDMDGVAASDDETSEPGKRQRVEP